MVAPESAIGCSVVVKVRDCVIVNMQGHIDLIDALGGVTLPFVKKMPCNVQVAKSKYPSLTGPDGVEIHGSIAMGFLWSRAADSDYSRMSRR